MTLGIPLNKIHASLVTQNWGSMQAMIAAMTQNAITQTQLEVEQIQEQAALGDISQKLKDKEGSQQQAMYHDQAWGAWGSAIGTGAACFAGVFVGLKSGEDIDPERNQETEVTLSPERENAAEEIEMQPMSSSSRPISEEETVAGAGTLGHHDAEESQEVVSAKATTRKATETKGTTVEAEKETENKAAEEKKQKEDRLRRREHALNMGMQTQQLLSGLSQNIANGFGQYYAGNDQRASLETQGCTAQAQTASQISDKNYQAQSGNQASYEKARDAALQAKATLISLSGVRG